ncbi:hypothetical protein [Catalinimonas niigatensis]|uniref:hypothetical protein n=1 Tax=Catalinimonas niigatensis TaxID=1397264 RepID=UPI0026658233|nr:hypothetical protein [Catalinimonas niigatensis]WPP52833.1 hypothetical protein PZB72_10640 [Catalinimonas niigatensis]
MTETKNHIHKKPHDCAHIIFNEHDQPKLYFDKLCLEAVTIARSINGEAWETLARNVRSPYVDETSFEHAKQVKYCIHFGKAKE